MKALLKTGETIEIIPNDDFCAAKYVNKETSEYVFNEEIVEIINEESEKPIQEGLEEEIGKSIENLEGCSTKINGNPEYHLINDENLREFARHFAQWGAEHLKK